MTKKILQTIFASALLFSFTQIAFAQYCTVPTATGFALVAGNCQAPTKQEQEANPLYYTSFSSPVKYTIIAPGDEMIYQCQPGKVLKPSLANYGMIRAYCASGSIPNLSQVASGGHSTVTGVGFTYNCGDGSCGPLTPSNVMPDPRAGTYNVIYTVSSDGVPVRCYATPAAGLCAPDRSSETITAVTNGVTYVTGQGYTYTCSNGACTPPIAGSSYGASNTTQYQAGVGNGSAYPQTGSLGGYSYPSVATGLGNGAAGTSGSAYTTTGSANVGGVSGAVSGGQQASQTQSTTQPLSDLDPNGSSPSCADLTSTALRYGSKDAGTNGEVTVLQTFLNDNSYLITAPTGFFGAGTLKAVKAFQKANGINPSGYVGANTRAKIKAIDCNNTISVAPVTGQASKVLGAYASNASCVDLPENLHRGAESSSVVKLQNFLTKKGLLVDEVSGFYGDKTIDAVKDYQLSKGMPVTGMVYDFTRMAIKADSCK